MIAFMATGIAFQIGSCTPEGRPVLCRGLAGDVLADGRLLVLLSKRSGFEVLDAVRATGRVAVNMACPANYRSLQFKGNDVELCSASGMGALLARFHEGFRANIEAIGYPYAFADGWYKLPESELAALCFMPTEAFDQTPGPGAGNALPLAQ